MRKWIVIICLLLVASSFCLDSQRLPYDDLYYNSLTNLEAGQKTLLHTIEQADVATDAGKVAIKHELARTRLQLKAADFWLRYLQPTEYKKINGPLAVEWENEVFEKFEPPYRREGAGLSLAEIYLGTNAPKKDSLEALIQRSIAAVNGFRVDSVTRQLSQPGHFFYCNRLYLLNLAAIYTTGFECPNNAAIIPELRAMMRSVGSIYASFDKSYPQLQLSAEYLKLYDAAIAFAAQQPDDYAQFDQFTFLRDYINPLFRMNQMAIREHGGNSASFNDYTLNNDCNSIFDKSLYSPQNAGGIYSLVTDTAVLAEIRHTGKLLFYDPILSGNNQRSCASCHSSKMFFTDTSMATAFNYDHVRHLPRNTPSLVNVTYNHLLMLDGKHISLQNQGKDVITNPNEMGCGKDDVVEKVMSCKEYKKAFKKFLRYTPEEKEVTLDHIVSAITLYYSSFSSYEAPFDEAMNGKGNVSAETQKGFNLFMGKAQCGTCHYVPMFNGVPPPYVGSEFEVIGVPDDKGYHKLSADVGRYDVNAANETRNAFRTNTVRNTEHTKPYMHNGVFNTLDEIIDFYNDGGGNGHGLHLANQTLSADSLRLSADDKKCLISFIHSLNENVSFEALPAELPTSSRKEYNTRKVGGEY